METRKKMKKFKKREKKVLIIVICLVGGHFWDQQISEGLKSICQKIFCRISKKEGVVK